MGKPKVGQRFAMLVRVGDRNNIGLFKLPPRLPPPGRLLNLQGVVDVLTVPLIEDSVEPSFHDHVQPKHFSAVSPQGK